MRRATLLLAAIAATSCSPQPESPTGSIALVNARVYTMNADAPEADAVVVRNDSILYVGDAAGAEPFIGESTDVRDLGGQLVLPGFIDTHSHLVVGGGYATALSLETWGTVDDWVQAIADYAAANEDAPLLFGYGFLATTFGPVGPTRLASNAFSTVSKKVAT
jgi:predicted amidohydrolase YtcJ